MGLLPLLASLWPFFKEMFVGEKINDSASSKRGQVQHNKPSSTAVLIARWCITKMQHSRKFLATVFTLLILSVFINYKLLNKLNAVMPRNEEKVQAQEETPVEPKEVKTIPHAKSTDRDVLHEQTVKELTILYGDKQ